MAVSSTTGIRTVKPISAEVAEAIENTPVLADLPILRPQSETLAEDIRQIPESERADALREAGFEEHRPGAFMWRDDGDRFLRSQNVLLAPDGSFTMRTNKGYGVDWRVGLNNDEAPEGAVRDFVPEQRFTKVSPDGDITVKNARPDNSTYTTQSAEYDPANVRTTGNLSPEDRAKLDSVKLTGDYIYDLASLRRL